MRRRDSPGNYNEAECSDGDLNPSRESESLA